MLKKRLVRIAIAGATLWAAWTGYFYLTTFPVSLVYTNDFHGNILPHKGRGGTAAIESFLKKNKRHYLLLDAGDFFQGTPESDLSKGKNTVVLMNRLGYDAATLGNHEFDFGQKTLEELSQIAEFPFLGANIYDKKNNKRLSFAKPYVVKELEGARIAILGLTSDRTPQMSLPENVANLEFRNPLEEAKKVLVEIKKEKPDIIVALTHLGFEKENQSYNGDKALANAADEIDIIVGGHTHTKVDGVKVNKSFIVQTSGLGRSVGEITLRLDKKTKKIRRIKNKITEMNVEKIGEDKDVKKIVAEMTKEISERLSEKIGEAKDDLTRKKDGESNLGSFLADIMREHAKTNIAFHNSGGIRTDIKKGGITLRDIYTLNPFDNTIVTMKLTGSQLKEIAQKSFGGTYGILQVSGLSMLYEKSSQKVELKFKNLPIEDKKLYSVATNSFLASGGDGFKTFTEGKNIKDTNIKFRDAVISHIKKIKNISAKTDGRITIK